MAPTTLIHNLSTKPIFLIPLLIPDAKIRQRTGQVEERKPVKKIPAGGFEKVDCGVYVQNTRVPSQIYILFRAGTGSDSPEQFKENLKSKYPNGVVARTTEILYLHSQLSPRPHWYLTVNKKGEVGQVSDNAEIQIERELLNLRNELQARLPELEKTIQNPQKGMETLNEGLKKLIEIKGMLESTLGGCVTSEASG